MQVLWYTMQERGKAFTKPPVALMCPCSTGQMNRGEIIFITGYKKIKPVKLGSKHIKRQPYWFSKCLRFQSGWRGDVCGVPGSKTNGQGSTNHPQGALPGVCCITSLLSSSRSLINKILNVFDGEMQSIVCIQVREHSSGFNQPPELSVTINLLIANLPLL